MIKVNNISFSYNKYKEVIKDMSFHIQDRESVGIIGANGAGKSTILKLIVGLCMVSDGEILVNDIKVENKNLPQIRKAVGYVFQDSDSQLFMSNIYQDVSFAPRNAGFDSKEVDKRTMTALNKMGIAGLKDRPVYSLSDGEKKLASVATVLSMNPEILIFDEPTVALDPVNRRNLIDVFNSIEETKIITSHDLDMVYDTCQRTILIDKGKVVADGDTKDILHDKQLLEEHGLLLPLSLSR